MSLWLAGVALLCALGAANPADAASAPGQLRVDAPGHPLMLWSRRPARPRGVVLLVHGRTWSARPAFDFAAHSGSRSLLAALAAGGYAAYAIDLPGYGATARDPSGWLEPDAAAAQVEAALGALRRRHPDLPPAVLLGWSRGSKISALVATRDRQPLSGLILYAFNLNLEAPPDNGPASGPPPARPNTAAQAAEDFVSPAVTSPQLIRDFVAAALSTDPIRADVCCDVQFQAIRPEAIRVPTLMLYGARDPAFKPAVAGAFFARLGTPERRWIIVGRGDHAAHLEDTAPEVAAALLDFLGATRGAGTAQSAHPD